VVVLFKLLDILSCSINADYKCTNKRMDFLLCGKKLQLDVLIREMCKNQKGVGIDNFKIFNNTCARWNFFSKRDLQSASEQSAFVMTPMELKMQPTIHLERKSGYECGKYRESPCI
jgi:hypothetical protein